MRRVVKTSVSSKSCSVRSSSRRGAADQRCSSAGSAASSAARPSARSTPAGDGSTSRAFEQAGLADAAGAVHEEHRHRRRIDRERFLDRRQLGVAADEACRGAFAQAVGEALHAAMTGAAPAREPRHRVDRVRRHATAPGQRRRTQGGLSGRGLHLAIISFFSSSAIFAIFSDTVCLSANALLSIGLNCSFSAYGDDCCCRCAMIAFG